MFTGPNIVKNGLVLWLDAANTKSYPDSGTNWADLSGNNYSGSLVNGPTFSSANNGSIVFDGVNDYTAFSNILNFTSEPFTFSYWINFVRLTTNQVNQGPIVFYKGSYQANGYYNQIGITGGIVFITNQGGAYQATSTNEGVISPGNWYNICYTRNGSSVKIYVNNVDRTASPATHINPASAVGIYFRLAMYSNDINGNFRLSNFLTYDRTLSAQEIQQNYNATKARYGL
jgi:hypothetical protein